MCFALVALGLIAFTEAEAQASVQEIGGPQARIGSLGAAVADLRAYLASHLAEWSREEKMMNANTLARQYAHLTPEERFRLIVAAGARGDDVERERLVRAGERICLSMPDHSPYGHAWDELSLLVFIELQEEAARYQEAFRRVDEIGELFGDDDEDDGGPCTETVQHAPEAPRSPIERYLDLALVAGYVLRTKAEGWKRFCQQLSLPPFALWEMLPGYDRLQKAVALAEEAAFAPEGFLRWFNRIRPNDEREATAVPLTVDGIANATAELFRMRVAWWGG